MTLQQVYARGAAIVLLALALALVWLSYSPIIADISEEQRLFSQNLERLSRFRAMQDQEAAIRQSLGSVGAYSAPVYAGPNASSISAAFQIDVNRFAGISGANVISMRPLNRQPQEGDEYERVALQVEMLGLTSQLARFLDELRSHRQLIVIERANIRASASTRGDRATTLSMSFELVAFAEIDQ